MKTMKKIAFIPFFLLSMTIVAQSAKLVYNLKKGDQYRVELDLKQNMAPILNMDINADMTLESLGMKGNDIDTQYKISGLMLNIAAQGQNMRYDSSKNTSELTDEERQVKAEIDPVLKMIVYQTINQKGKVLSTKIEPQVQGAGAMINQNQFLFIEFPNKSVKVGSTWDFGQNMNGMAMQTKYVVTKITSDKVYADIKGSLEGTPDAKIGGKAVIDRASGLMSSMNFDVSVGSSGLGSLSMNINLKITKI